MKPELLHAPCRFHTTTQGTPLTSPLLSPLTPFPQSPTSGSFHACPPSWLCSAQHLPWTRKLPHLVLSTASVTVLHTLGLLTSPLVAPPVSQTACSRRAGTHGCLACCIPPPAESRCSKTHPIHDSILLPGATSTQGLPFYSGRATWSTSRGPTVQFNKTDFNPIFTPGFLSSTGDWGCSRHPERRHTQLTGSLAKAIKEWLP